jgi:hypothetical protein
MILGNVIDTDINVNNVCCACVKWSNNGKFLFIPNNNGRINVFQVGHLLLDNIEKTVEKIRNNYFIEHGFFGQMNFSGGGQRWGKEIFEETFETGGEVAGHKCQKIVYANPHFRQKADGRSVKRQVWNENYNKPRVGFTGYGQDPRENQAYKSQHLQNIKKVSDLYPEQTTQKNGFLHKSASTKLEKQEIYGRLRQDMHDQKSSLMKTRNYLPADMIGSED